MITAPVFLPVEHGSANPTGLYVLGGGQGVRFAQSFPARAGFSTALILTVPAPAPGTSREYTVRVTAEDPDGRRIGAGQVEVVLGVNAAQEGVFLPTVTIPACLPEFVFDVDGEFDGSLLLTVDGERVSSFPVSIRQAPGQS